MRREPTDAEALLWERLRDRRLCGAKFRRQHPIGPYIADFVCLEAALIVEVDGSVHSEPDQAMRDRDRTAILEGLAYRVLRFANDDVEKAMDRVLSEVASALAERGVDR